MGTQREVVAGGRVYSVVNDVAIEHRLVLRGKVTDAVTLLPLTVAIRVTPLHPRAFAVVRPEAKYLLAVGANPPAIVRLTVSAPGYQDETTAVALPPVGTVKTVNVSLTPAPV